MKLQNSTKRILSGFLLALCASPASNPTISMAESVVSRNGFTSSMHGTLIGNFITKSSIVIGSDSIVSDDNGAILLETDKTCQPSIGSIATIQGEYGMPVMSGKSSAFLHHRSGNWGQALLSRHSVSSLQPRH